PSKQRPTELQGPGSVEGGIKSDPHFGRGDFYLENSRHSKIVDGQNEGQDSGQADGSAGDWQEKNTAEGPASHRIVALQLSRFEPPPGTGHSHKGNWPKQQTENPNSATEGEKRKRQPAMPHAHVAQEV